MLSGTNETTRPRRSRICSAASRPNLIQNSIFFSIHVSSTWVMASDGSARGASLPSDVSGTPIILSLLHCWEIHVRTARSEEHTSELQSLMRISYAVFCLKKKITQLCYFSFLDYSFRLT